MSESRIADAAAECGRAIEGHELSSDEIIHLLALLMLGLADTASISVTRVGLRVFNAANLLNLAKERSSES